MSGDALAAVEALAAEIRSSRSMAAAIARNCGVALAAAGDGATDSGFATAAGTAAVPRRGPEPALPPRSPPTE